MLRKQFYSIVIICLLLSLHPAAIVDAAPGFQTGQQEEADTPPEGDEQEGGEDESGPENSTGDTIDLSKVRPNLGTVMSGKYQTNNEEDDPADDGDDPTDDTGETPEGDDESNTDDDAAGGAGDDNAEEEEPDADTGKPHPVANALANFFDVSYDEVIDLHQTGNGFGNIAKAYFFSTVIDTTAAELLTETKGTGWGNVLKSHGIHPGAVGRGIQDEAPEDDANTPEESNDGGSAGMMSSDTAGSSGNLVGPGGGNGQANGPNKITGPGKAGQGNPAKIDNNGNGNGKGKGKNNNNGRGRGQGKKK